MKRMANNKMKGLLKGLRYISQVFDNDKEYEIQIGYPTDVKHVAHVGLDGPSVAGPSWMREVRSPCAATPRPENNRRQGSTHNNPTGIDPLEVPRSSKTTSSSEGKENSEKPRRRSTATDTGEESGSGTSTSTSTGTSSGSSRKPGEKSGKTRGSSGSDTLKKFRRRKSKELATGGNEAAGEGSPKRAGRGAGGLNFRSGFTVEGQNTGGNGGEKRGRRKGPGEAQKAGILGRVSPSGTRIIVPKAPLGEIVHERVDQL